jgi:hypothetical protein
VCLHFPPLPTQLTLRSCWSTGRLCLCREVDLLTPTVPLCATLCHSLPLSVTLPLISTRFHPLPLTAIHFHSLPLTATHFRSVPLISTLISTVLLFACLCHCLPLMSRLFAICERSLPLAMSMHMCPVRRALSTSTLSAQPNSGCEESDTKHQTHAHTTKRGAKVKRIEQHTVHLTLHHNSFSY